MHSLRVQSSSFGQSFTDAAGRLKGDTGMDCKIQMNVSYAVKVQKPWTTSFLVVSSAGKSGRLS